MSCDVCGLDPITLAHFRRPHPTRKGAFEDACIRCFALASETVRETYELMGRPPRSKDSVTKVAGGKICRISSVTWESERLTAIQLLRSLAPPSDGRKKRSRLVADDELPSAPERTTVASPRPPPLEERSKTLGARPKRANDSTASPTNPKKSPAATPKKVVAPKPSAKATGKSKQQRKERDADDDDVVLLVDVAVNSAPSYP